MSQLVRNSEEGEFKVEEQWTHSKYMDEFFIHLTRIKDPNKSDSVTENQRIFLNNYKYYAQARKLIYLIPISKPEDLIPPFIIDTKDLQSNSKLYSEFKEFISLSTEKDIAFFLKEIAVKFFEAIAYAYTHISVIPHIAVGIK